MKRATIMLLFVILSLILPYTTTSNINNHLNGDIIKHNIVLTDIYQNINKLQTKSTHYIDSLPIHKPLKLDKLFISSDYGYRKHPIKHRIMFHSGIDLPAKMGTPILAVADGVIVKTRASRWNYGNMIIIKHASGFTTIYAHLSSILVKEGQHVVSGQTIGKVGSTGLSTGPHLHYEVRLNNKHIDPLFFVYNNKKDRSIKRYFKYLKL